MVYTSDQMPGIKRKRSGEGFEYYGPDGSKLEDEETLQRVRSLAVPPAYEDVWICPLENGHMQATGKDARGRKQYRYHSKFREIRDESKFDRMAEFGRTLPEIHARLDRDLAKRGLPREKVLAAVVMLLEKSFIRVGNEEYAKENKSYGLTTLRNRHVQVEGSDIKFSFLGKSKVKHQITLHDRKLARVVAKIQDLPGQELFQYLDEDGARCTVTSNDVNGYLKEISGHDFTAKDFRTWAGTVLALTQLLGAEPAETKKKAKATVTGAIKVVAEQLGNTPAVCRKCYIHPVVLETYATGSLTEFMLQKPPADPQAVAEVVECAEDAVIQLLQRYAEEKQKATSKPRSRQRKKAA